MHKLFPAAYIKNNETYKNNSMNILIRFVIYGCFGMFLETVWTGMGSAVSGDKKLKCSTYLWMFPIYGTGILLEPLHDFIRGFLWIYRGFIWAAVIFLIEYTTGYMLKFTLGECPWNYDSDGEVLASVRGIIRLDFLPVWFGVGLLFERAHDFIKIYI